jgi:hypothetical protein
MSETNILQSRSSGNRPQLDRIIVRTGRYEKASLPNPREFFESELSCQLSRADHRGEARGNCCFHSSKSRRSFTVNLQTGTWFCFGCAFGGDQVSFLRRRYGLSFIDACKSLGAWVEDGTLRPRPAKKTEPTSPIRLLAEAVINDPTKAPEQIQRIELRNEIQVLVEIQADVSNRLSLLLRGGPPAYESEVEDCWGAMSLVCEDLRNCEAEYMAAIGAEYLG